MAGARGGGGPSPSEWIDRDEVGDVRFRRDGDGPEGAIGEVEGARFPGGLEDPLHGMGLEASRWLG